jgi:hypothetical protein
MNLFLLEFFKIIKKFIINNYKIKFIVGFNNIVKNLKKKKKIFII